MSGRRYYAVCKPLLDLQLPQGWEQEAVQEAMQESALRERMNCPAVSRS
jgi:hypothetical protein